MTSQYLFIDAGSPASSSFFLVIGAIGLLTSSNFEISRIVHSVLRVNLAGAGFIGLAGGLNFCLRIGFNFDALV